MFRVTNIFRKSSGRYQAVAGPIHTVLVLVVLACWALTHEILPHALTESNHPNRIRSYLFALLFEWLLFALVIAGVRFSRNSSLIVLGNHWRSVKELLRDVGIAAGFWIISAGLLWVFAWLLRIHGSNAAVLAMLPHGGAELTCWIALSITAGICEEAIFRGYLQPQFMALTQSAPVGILISAVLFGLAHAYQGAKMVVLISIYGVMFGILANWRRSVRPGMIAHAWQDSLSGVAFNLMAH